MSATWSAPPIGVRTKGWEQHFTEILSHHIGQPFAWGVSDCLILPAELCWGMTGVQPFPRELRRYRSAPGAQRLLLELGFEDVEGPLKAAFKPVSKALARRGDCGTRRTTIDGVETLSTFIVTGDGMAVGKADSGPVWVPVVQLEQCYQIGLRRSQVER